jgi:hypothetical protein
LVKPDEMTPYFNQKAKSLNWESLIFPGSIRSHQTLLLAEGQVSPGDEFVTLRPCMTGCVLAAYWLAFLFFWRNVVGSKRGQMHNFLFRGLRAC